MKNKTRKYVMPLLAALPALSVVSTGVVLASCSNSESVKLGVLHEDQIYLSQSTAVKGSALTLVVRARPGYVLDINSFEPIHDIHLYSDPQAASEIDTQYIDAIFAESQLTLIFNGNSVASDIYVDCPVIKGLAVSNYDQVEDQERGIIGDTSHFMVTGSSTTFIPGRPFTTEFSAIRQGGNQEFRFYTQQQYCSEEYPFGIYAITADGEVYEITEFLEWGSNYWFNPTASYTKMDFTLNFDKEKVESIEATLTTQAGKPIKIDNLQVRMWMCQGYYIRTTDAQKNIISINNPQVWENHDAVIHISPATDKYVLLHGTTQGMYQDNNAVKVYIRGQSGHVLTDGYTYTVDSNRNFATLTIDAKYITEENLEDGIEFSVDYTNYVTAVLDSDVKDASQYIQFDDRVLQRWADVPGVSYQTTLTLSDLGLQKYEIAEAWATQMLYDEAEGKEVETVIHNFYEERAWTIDDGYRMHFLPKESQYLEGKQGYESNGKAFTIHTEIANLLLLNDAKPIDDITVDNITYKRYSSPLTRLGTVSNWELKTFNFIPNSFTETSGKINGLKVAAWGRYSRFYPEWPLKLSDITISVNGTVIGVEMGKWEYNAESGVITFVDDFISADDTITVALKVSQSTTYADYFRYGKFVAWQAQAAE